MAIIPDTLSGALVLSVFDFIACFFVLWGISFLIRGLGLISSKFPESTEACKKS
ncbi:hypothetical protein DSOL_3142 [Desulfosporosinus metallidurans]|uniref:Uncharacterized protein n=1 Tax=Desulfosporosinus metallidurans TaxID=1888891 RepID=A0A1Q8QS74_9FIRM|nr:hypothetical protein DSOL_3142 [Desulfosporosinus metallidurans]